MTDRIAQLQRLLDADPNDAFCLYGLAMEHAKRGNTRQAVELFDRTLQADPTSSYAHFHKAKSLEAAGELDAARTALKDGLAVARRVGDSKAASEIAAFLDEIT